MLSAAPIAVGELYYTNEATPLVVSGATTGARIFQSTSNPSPGGFGGSSIMPEQFLGARFQVTSPTTTGRVGGLIGGSGTAFAALVALSSPDDFPDSFDLSTPDVLGQAQLTLPGGNGVIVSSPLEIPLSPGWYAIVIGTGTFGTSGQGYMPSSGSGIYEVFNTSKIWTDGSWRWNSQPERQNHFLVDAKGSPANLLANDIGTPPTPLTAVLETPPQHGVVTIGPSGSFVYTPSAGFVGTDTFSYRASDGENSSAPATVSIVVRSGVTPAAVADVYSVVEGNPLSVTASSGLLVNDAGSGLSAQLLIGPERGTLTLLADGSFNYAPEAGFTGADRFWYRLHTANNVSAPALVTLEVTNVIEAPVATDDLYRIERNAVLSAGVGQIAAERIYLAAAQKLQSVNLDGSDLRTIMVPSTSPDAVAVDMVNGWFYWTLGPADFKIYRSRLDGTQVQPLVTINPVPNGGQNPTPNVADITLDVAGGKMYWLTHGLYGTPGKVWRANLDGTAVETIVNTGNYPGGLELDLLHRKVYWTNRDGKSIQRANLDGTGVETVVSGQTSPNSMTLDVAGGMIYWFSGEYYQTNQLKRAKLDGSSVETLLTLPHSSMTDMAFEPIEGKLYWTDGTGALWSSNRHGAELTQLLFGGVAGASGLSLDQNFGSGYANNLLANDAVELPAGAAVSIELVSDTEHGTLALNADGTFVYDSDPGFQGTDSFTYRITAGELVSNVATVHLSIIRENDIPAEVATDAYSATEDSTLVVDAATGVLANDTDAEGDLLVASLASSPAHGTIELSENGGFSYAPAANYFGEDSFTYRAWDGYKFSELATVTIAVAPVAEAPVAAVDQYYVAAGTTLRVSLPAMGTLANDEDADGEAISAALLSSPAHGILAFNADGTFTYTPQAGYLGGDSFTYRAADATLSSAPTQVSLNVLPAREVTGYVWTDANANGRQELGEPPAVGVTVRLLDSDERILATAQTDATGAYSLGGLAVAHDYFVEIVSPEGTMFTRRDAGSDDGIDSDIIRATGRSEAIQLALTEFDRTIDAGLASSAIGADVYENLRISELLFIGHGHAEFIELTNIGLTPLDLAAVRFTDGVYFDFATSDVSVLLPGERIVLVGDEELFHSNYPSTEIVVAGQFSGRLNQEERLVMEGPGGDVILDFTYDDDWFAITDNEFSPFAISVLDLDAPPAAWNAKSNWRPGSLAGGSPGFEDPHLTPNPGTIVISEFMANPLTGERDWIEVHNTTNQPFDIGNWYLGDGRGYGTMRYQIPEGTIIPANGYLVFNRHASFQFGLDKGGDSVYLTAGNDEGRVLGYSEMAEHYVASESGISLGRFVTSGGRVDYARLAAPTPGSANALPKIGPLVINEVMYKPAEGHDEFIEIYNATDQALPLDAWNLGTFIIDPHGSDEPANLFSFPHGVTIPAGGYALVVSIAADEFRAKYAIPTSVPVMGALEGLLSDETQTLQLIHDGDDKVVIDNVEYHTGGYWPVGASMGGRSLERIAPPEYANEATHWQASMAIGGTPGASNTTVAPPPPGDFNGDFVVDWRDIDLIHTYLSNPTFTNPPTTGTPPPGTLPPTTLPPGTLATTMFDVTSDGTFTTADVTHLITTIMHSAFGDVNLDGSVGLADLMTVRRNLGLTSGSGTGGTTGSGQATLVSWASGDVNGDGRVDRADLAVVSANFGKVTNLPQSADAAIVAIAGERGSAAAAIIVRANSRPTPLVPVSVDRVLTAESEATVEAPRRNRSTRMPQESSRTGTSTDVQAPTEDVAQSKVRAFRTRARR